MVCEGSYPYVSGGVSSWVHTLISSMKEHEFYVFSIVARNQDLVPQYDFPENVSKHIVLSIDLSLKELKRKRKLLLTKEEEELLTQFFTMKTTDPQALTLLAKINQQLQHPSRFFLTENYWRILQICYEGESQDYSLIEYFYMLQGMYLPILACLQDDFVKLDTIHSVSTGYAGLVGSFISEKQNIPLILTEHGIYTREREEEILLAEWIPAIFKRRWMDFFHHLGQITYNQAEKIITLFERNAKVQRSKGASPGKQLLIKNGVVIPSLQHNEAKKTSVFHIGSVIRVVPIKDIKTMLYAAKELKGRGQNVKWSILGPLTEDKEYAEECLQLLQELNLIEEVKFFGKVKVDTFLPMFDVCVLSSISEGQPLSILEAFSYGVPCITTDVGACRELLYGDENDELGRAGIIVPPVSPKQLADAIEVLKADEGKRREMGEIGRRRVNEYYQQKDMIHSYRSIYEGRESTWLE